VWLGSVLVAILTACGALAQEDGPAAAALDRAFEASPSDLLHVAALGGQDTDASIELLLDEGSYQYDDQGRLSRTTRQVYRCLKRESLDEHGAVQVLWRPWFQNRPEFRARVVAPDKSVRELDPATIEEVRIPSQDPRVFTDVVLVRAPLPSLAVGAVVETEVRVSERLRFAQSGATQYFQFATSQPVRQVRVTIRAPRSLAIRHRLFGIQLAPRVHESERDRTLVFEAGPLAAVQPVEELSPSHVAPAPSLGISTSASWSEAAREYAEIVEEQLRGTDLADLVGKLVQAGESRDATAARILRRLHQLVRYTGVEFGRAAIVPRSPVETLSRGYGDCKDKAVLLVAMLRQAGIPAHVALLRASSGWDVPEDLPGLDQFNHAIVYVPGDTPLWIDPTAEFVPVGRLPPVDEGRLALVAAPTTDRLVPIPRAAASDNRVISRCDLLLSETAPTRLVVKTEHHGGYASSFRALHSVQNGAPLRAWFENLGKSFLGSQTLSRLEVAGAEQLDQPLEVTCEYEDVGMGSVDGISAVAFIAPATALDFLPPALLSGQPSGSNVRSALRASGGSRARKSPLVLATPFQRHVQFHIIPPPGFTPPPMLPRDETVALGPARLVVRYRNEEPNHVVADIELDTGNGIFTPEEVGAVHALLAGQGAQGDQSTWNQQLQFVQAAGKWLLEGKLVQALQEYHRLLESAPRDAIRHAQFANALLHVGLGEEARQHARRATELDADSADTHYQLAAVLSCNGLGEHLAPGLVRDEALAAFRRALELEPGDRMLRLELANLLRLGADGIAYGEPRDLAAAIAEYRQVYEQEGGEELLGVMVTAMREVGQRKAARALLEEAQPSATQQTLLVAVMATDEGVAAAQARAAELIPQLAERRATLESLVNTLQNWSEYETAQKLCEALAEGSPRAADFRALAERLRGQRRVDLTEFDQRSPKAVVLRHILQATLLGELSEPALGCCANVPDRAHREAWHPEVPSWVWRIGQQHRIRGHSRQQIADGLSTLDFKVEGDDDSGYRVRVGHKSFPQLTGDWFVVLREGKYCVLRAGIADSELGRHALWHLSAGRTDAAKRWLEWAWQRQKAAVGWFDAFAGTPFGQLWMWEDKSDESTIKLAAAALATASRPNTEAREILRALQTQPVGEQPASRRLQIMRALLGAELRDDQHEEALRLASELAEQRPQAAEPFAAQTHLLTLLGRHDELIAVATARAARLPKEAVSVMALAGAATAKGDLAAARKQLDLLAERPDLSPWEHASLAWLWLFQEPVAEQASAHARQAVELSQQEDLDALYLWAIVAAERGDVPAAIQLLRLAVQPFGESAGPRTTFTLGRIAEHCGLRAIALHRYRQIERSQGGEALSLYALARHRIKLLEPQGAP